MTKRTFDVMTSLVALILLAPLMAVTAILVRLLLGSPILFRQERPGLDCRPFRLLKFRTMTDARGADGALLPDSERLTGFGRFLRATSIDELPELWNVLRGDMSLVGPRPLLMRYLPLYNARELRRHETLPGLTGLAQVSGRNGLSWPEKFELDIFYVENRTFWMDIRILFRTVLMVLKREGISQSGEATMAPFSGSGAEGR